MLAFSFKRLPVLTFRLKRAVDEVVSGLTVIPINILYAQPTFDLNESLQNYS